VRIPGRKFLRQQWRRWRSQRAPHGVILGYHRVAAVASDPFDLTVAPSAFEDQLAFLAQRARVVPLPQLLEELASGSIPSRTVALTFDDGTDDTLSTVLPALERHALPATIFVTTGNLGAPYWWDALGAAVLGAGTLPARLSLRMPAGVETWSSSDRQALLASLSDTLRPLDAVLRDALVREVVTWSGVAMPASPRALTRAEVGRLAAHRLITIGAHSVTHPLMAGRAVADQRREVEECVTTLVNAGAVTPRTFSYPHGAFDATTQEVLRESGFVGACCSEPDVATAASDAYALPRLWVDRTQRGPFAPWLEGWL